MAVDHIRSILTLICSMLENSMAAAMGMMRVTKTATKSKNNAMTNSKAVLPVFAINGRPRKIGI